MKMQDGNISNIINRCSQITENYHHLLTTCEAKARQMWGVASNLETTSDSQEWQVEANVSSGP